MKYCRQCGGQMQNGDKFCMNCGSEYKGTRGGIESSVPQVIPAKEKPLSGLMTKLLIGAVLAIILAAGGFWGWNTYGTEAQAEKKLDLAVKYLSNNNYEQAILAFNDAIKIDPKEVKGYQGLARTYTIQGNYDSAKDTYEKGITVVTTPQNKQILELGLAGMYIDQNKLTDAEQTYSQIMDSSPNCLEAYWGLAMVYNQQGDNNKAEAILRQAVEKNPNEYKGYSTLALYLSQNNKQDEALDNIVQSLTLELNQQEAYLVLDSMYRNRWSELGSQAISLSNQTISAMLEFYSYYAAGDYPNALNTYRSKLTSQTTNQKARILAAICTIKNGDKTSAKTIIKQIDTSKLNGWLLGDLGRYYLAVGDLTKAREYALKALQAQTTNLDAIALLQAIDANDPDAKFYTAKALLYNWRPIQESGKSLIDWAETSQQRTGLDSELVDSEPVDPNERGNTIGNIADGGIAALKEDWIYCSDLYNGGLFRIRTDNSIKTKINDDKASFINVIGNWIYYRNENDHGSIYKARTDGTHRTKLVGGAASEISVVGGWIYYNVPYGGPSGVYKIQTDGSLHTKLTDNAAGIVVMDEWVFFHRLNNFYKIRTNGSAETKVIDISPRNTNLVNDWIYYVSTWTGEIYKMHFDGSGVTKIIGGGHINDGTLNVDGDWIYFENSRDNLSLYKCRLDGSQLTKLNDDWSSKINVVGDWIYYQNNSDDGKIYRIRNDGTGRQVVF